MFTTNTLNSLKAYTIAVVCGLLLLFAAPNATAQALPAIDNKGTIRTIYNGMRDWVLAAAYMEGQFVVRDNIIYRANAAIAANTAFAEGTTGATWTLISGADGNHVVGTIDGNKPDTTPTEPTAANLPDSPIAGDTVAEIYDATAVHYSYDGTNWSITAEYPISGLWEPVGSGTMVVPAEFGPVQSNVLTSSMTATQPSTYLTNVASNAINGDTTSDRSLSNSQAFPWWKLDMGGVFALDKVRLYQHGSSQQRLSNVHVIISENDITLPAVPTQADVDGLLATTGVTSVYHAGQVASPSGEVSFASRTNARYMIIVRNVATNDFLQMREVEAEGAEQISPATTGIAAAVSIPSQVGVNVALPTDTFHVGGDTRLEGALKDSNNQAGTAGQILSSTATGTQWINSGTHTGSGAPTSTNPENPNAGDIYVDESTGDVYTFDGTNWVQANRTTSGSGAPTSTTPANPQAGDIYVDESTGDVYTFNGSTNAWENQRADMLWKEAQTNGETIGSISENVLNPSMTATQSSTHMHNNQEASNAINGNTSNPQERAGTGGGDHSWWKVDMGTVFAINKVRLYQAGNDSPTNHQFLSDIYVILSETDINLPTVPTQANIDTLVADMGTTAVYHSGAISYPFGDVNFPGHTRARYMIVVRYINGTFQTPIAIREVEAEGYEILPPGSDGAVSIPNAVGVNVAAPTDTFHVGGDARIEGALKDSNNNAGTAGQILSSTATGTRWLDVDGDGDVVSTDTGNVIIEGTDGLAFLNETALGQYSGPGAPTSTSPANPEAGDLYVDDGTGDVYSYNGSTWVNQSNNWELTGNAGTNPTTNFLGTTDNVDVVLRANNVERMRLKANGDVGIGTNDPTRKLDVVGEARVRGLVGPGIISSDSDGNLSENTLFNVRSSFEQWDNLNFGSHLSKVTFVGRAALAAGGTAISFEVIYEGTSFTILDTYNVTIATPSANVLRLSSGSFSMDLSFDKANGTIEILNGHSHNWIQGTFLVQAW